MTDLEMIRELSACITKLSQKIDELDDKLKLLYEGPVYEKKFKEFQQEFTDWLRQNIKIPTEGDDVTYRAPVYDIDVFVRVSSSVGIVRCHMVDSLANRHIEVINSEAPVTPEYSEGNYKMLQRVIDHIADVKKRFLAQFEKHKSL